MACPDTQRQRHGAAQQAGRGTGGVRERRQRIGRNPHKPDQVVVIPSRKVVRFRPGKTMKEMFK